MSAKTVEYYLSLVYDLVLRKVNADGEEMYMVYTRELDKDVFYGVGTTIEEAIDSFNSVKEELFEDFVDRGLHIPEPEPVDEDLPSGKFMVRTSPAIHKKLIDLARRDKRSLNALVCSILDRYATLRTVEAAIEKKVAEMAGPVPHGLNVSESFVCTDWSDEGSSKMTDIRPYSFPRKHDEVVDGAR